MNIKEFKESLPYLFKAEVTAFIWGQAGIGKSSIVKQYAHSQGYKFFPLYLGTQSDIGDVLGLAEFIRDSDGNPIATVFATPVWLKDLIDHCVNNPESGAILFLDEFNRARHDVLQGMFSLALDKTFHTIKLPKNLHIIAAGNPPTDDYTVTDVSDTALMSRFAHIKLDPSVSEWVDFAKSQKYDPNMIAFIQEQPKLLEDVKSEFDLPVKVDRRAFERIQKLLDVGTPTEIMTQLMKGILGLERTIAYEKFLLSSDRPLTGAEILTGEGLGKVENWSNPTDTKSSLLAASCNNLTKHLTEDNVELTITMKDNIIKFVSAIPKELAVVFFTNNLSIEHSWLHKLKLEPEYEKQLYNIVKAARGKK